MNSTFYVSKVLIMMLVAIIFLPLCGCSHKYNYSTIDTTAFSKSHTYKELPNATEVTISKQTLQELENSNITENVVYLNNPSLTNYIVEDLDDYTLFFTTPSIVTINATLKNLSNPAIISTANYLGLNLKASIFSNILSPLVLETTTTDTSGDILSSDNSTSAQPLQIQYNSIITATNVDVYASENIKLTELSGNTIQAQNLNLVNGYINISAPDIAVNTGSLNIYGGNIIFNSDNTAINAGNVNIYGGTLEINSGNIGINSANCNIFNGNIKVNAQNTAIFTQNLIKNQGYVCINSLYGILADNIKITGGYLYCNCNFTCIKVSIALAVSGGTNLFVASRPNRIAIEAETAKFTISGGLVIQNSTYVCVPQDNYLCFNVQAADLFTLSGKNSSICYIPTVAGSLMVGSADNYTLYSLAGNLVSYKDNFYGLLLGAKVNNNQVTSVNAAKVKNYGAQMVFSGNNYPQKQLF